jgi:hypothetical protein
MVKVGVVVIAAAMGIGVAWANWDWSAARSKADEFKSRHQDLRKLDPDETRRVVTAICEADEDARKDAGRDAFEHVVMVATGDAIGRKLAPVQLGEEDAAAIRRAGYVARQK